ncbi:MAG TPA: hypothetical protein VFT12_10015 [Thermoanaerobaculia bacterium]|nr:hypothetical protein [Thermoanaerobaculia bacterium]
MPNKRFLISIGVAGIMIELIAVALLAAKTLTTGIAVPIMVVGMFLALVPMFALARSARKR